METPSESTDLRRLANEVRRRSLRMVFDAGMGHPGGDLSAADILVTLYFRILQIDPSQPGDPHRDRFIMSKGHCSASFYCTLAKAGFFPEEELSTFMQPGSRLNGHPARGKTPGVEASTGPLGHGLPVAVGSALASKIDGKPWRTFVLTGDGELQEGSNWEAAMAAANYELDNLALIIDRNMLQLTDATERVMRLEPLVEKWASFGWAVRAADGHDPEALAGLLSTVPFEPGKPSCVIVRTHKGQGVSFARDQASWHHHVPTREELDAALRELGGGEA